MYHLLTGASVVGVIFLIAILARKYFYIVLPLIFLGIIYYVLDLSYLTTFPEFVVYFIIVTIVTIGFVTVFYFYKIIKLELKQRNYERIYLEEKERYRENGRVSNWDQPGRIPYDFEFRINEKKGIAQKRR